MKKRLAKRLAAELVRSLKYEAICAAENPYEVGLTDPENYTAVDCDKAAAFIESLYEKAFGEELETK